MTATNTVERAMMATFVLLVPVAGGPSVFWATLVGTEVGTTVRKKTTFAKKKFTYMEKSRYSK